MLGQPVSMLIPESHRLPSLPAKNARRHDRYRSRYHSTVTNMLRKKGVVGKFVEFYGDGLDSLPLSNRATIANMAPEYGATCGIFPVDAETIRYTSPSPAATKRIFSLVGSLRQGTRHVARQEFFRARSSATRWSWTWAPSSPRSPAPNARRTACRCRRPPAPLPKRCRSWTRNAKTPVDKRIKVGSYDMGHGDVAIAAITSCTNTSNPSVMIAAGLVARKARERGITVKPWVKTSLAPGSQVVTAYLEATGLSQDLDALGFELVGYGCTTCITCRQFRPAERRDRNRHQGQ